MTYCTATDVASLLRLTEQDDSGVMKRVTFSTTTDPTLSEVNAWIEEADDEIDRITHSSFGEKQVIAIKKSRMPYRNTGGMRRLFLDHRNLLDWDTDTEGDKLEKWEDDAWSEVDTDDYHVDEEDGIIIIGDAIGYPSMPITRLAPMKVKYRVTYRIGSATVPPSIRKASAMLTAMRIVGSDDYRKILPSGTDASSVDAKLDRMRKEVDGILSRYQEMMAVVP